MNERGRLIPDLGGGKGNTQSRCPHQPSRLPSQAAAAPAEAGTITLNDGCKHPPIAFGTYKCGFVPASSSEAATVEASGRDIVLSALEAGYRMLDLAEFYGNEHEVGRAIADSKGVERSDLYLVSKVKFT